MQSEEASNGRESERVLFGIEFLGFVSLFAKTLMKLKTLGT